MPEREGTTHYDVLGVTPDASAAEIRRAFQRLTLAHHPDRNRTDPSAGARMAEINAAYRILRDRKKRAEYDALLSSQTRYAVADVADDAFKDARTRWKRADTERQEWREYVREVQTELRGWTDSRLQAFVLNQGVLVDNAASSEERSMHQWFTDAALEEIESRRKSAEQERAERERRRQAEREMHRRAARERAEQARREQLERDAAEQERAEREQRRQAEREMHRRAALERAEQARREQLERDAAERERREAQQREAPLQSPGGVVTPPTGERRPEGRARRVVRRLAARIGVAVAVLLAHLFTVLLIGGTDPDNPEVASNGVTIAVVIWLLCAMFALALATADAFEKVTEVGRKHILGVLAALIILSIVISAVVG